MRGMHPLRLPAREVSRVEAGNEAGIEGGPTIMRTRDGVRVGLTVSPWIGAIVVPYYAHTWLLGGTSIRELGTYLKLPLCTGCEGSGGGGDWDWDDDD